MTWKVLGPWLSLGLLLSLQRALAGNTVLSDGYPVIDKTPEPIPSWSALYDFSSVPELPIRSRDAASDWGGTDILNCTIPNAWGITFDDGPSPYTPALLDYLDKTGVKATFFVVGSRLKEHAETLVRAFRAGHEIAVHTWSHAPLTTLTNDQIVVEMGWTAKAIKELLGVTPRFARPPFGDIDDRVRGVLAAMGYRVVIWNRDSNDWQMGDPSAKFNPEWVTGNFSQWAKLQNGVSSFISLEHDLYEQSAKRAPQAIETVRKAGFQVMPVAACLKEPAYLESLLEPVERKRVKAKLVRKASASLHHHHRSL